MKHIYNTIIRLSVLMSVATAITMTPSNAIAQSPGHGAQSPGHGHHMNPYAQRLSPYLDLLRNDNSVLSPYHSFVQPRRQVQMNQAAQARQIQSIQRTMQRPPSRSRQVERTQTGRGGTFNNYLHFYQFSPTGNH